MFLMSPAISQAEEIRLSASAPSTVGTGERFRITYSINARPDRIEAPAFEGFRVISGPSQSSSTSTQIINNQVTTTVSFSYTYLVEALAEGEFRIPPATARVDGKSYTSDALQILVDESVGPTSHATPSRPEAEPDEPDRPTTEDIFIRSEVSKPDPCQGEQVIISYSLFTRLPVTNFSIEKLPGFQALWSENITGRGQPSVSTREVNGITYNVAEIRRVAVFPQRSGEIRIEPMEVEMAVRMRTARPRRPGSLFDDFFGGSPFDSFQTITHRVQSNAITLSVKPLPAQNRPGSFRGMVGDFDVEASISHQELAVNDAANLVVTIKGHGNLRMAEPPEIQFPRQLDVFDPQISDNISAGRNGISGQRTFDYVIIPRSGGTVDIPAIHFSYFDPQRQEYITKTAGPFTINVDGGHLAGTEGTGIYGDGSYLAEDIRFIHTRPISWKSTGELFFRSMNFYLFAIVPVIILLIFLVIWRKRLQMLADESGMRTRKARKVAVKRLKKAALLLRQQNKEAFFDEIFKALWGYVSDRLNIPVARLNKENVNSAFQSRQVSGELAKSFLEGLQECEFARFSPKGMESPMETTYNKALDTIVTLEKELRHQGTVRS